MTPDESASAATATRSSTRDAMLAQKFVGLADTLVDDFDVVDLMDDLVKSCLDLLDATAAGLLLIDQRGGLQLAASSSEQTRLLELFQLQYDEGPCLDCVHGGEVVTVDDLAANRVRWPRFVDAALEVGYVSVHALPMRLRSETIGGLNIFKSSGPQLTLDEQRVAQALADVATIGILQQRSIHRVSLLAEQLQTALTSRVVIEQAKGVLAEYGQVSMEAAFLALRWFSRDHNIRLTALAERVINGTVVFDRVLEATARQRRG